MKYLVLALLGFFLGYLGSDKFLTATTAEQDEAVDALVTVGQIALLPIVGIAVAVLTILFANSDFGKKLLGFKE